MDLHEVGCGDMDWIDVAEDRVGSIKCGEFLELLRTG